MKTLNRKIAVAISLLLAFSMVASMTFLPNAKALSSQKIITFAYVQGNPNPCGVGQQARVYMWLEQVLPGATLGNGIRFHDYELTITPPTGAATSVTFANITDPTSSQGYTFTPTQVGTYTLNFTFPGQTYDFTTPPQYALGTNTVALDGQYYEPSHASATLVVQQTAPPVSQNAPLPSMYWTRPIYGYNSLWYSISSNWLGVEAPGFATGYPGDAIGPLTSHIMWTRADEAGGIVGGSNLAAQGDTYFEGSAYVQRFEDPIIMDGMLFYTEPLSFGGTPGSFTPQPTGPTVAVNLQSGQTIWSFPSNVVPKPTFGYIYDVQEPNQHGVYQPILFSASFGTWRAFDAYTGTAMFNVTNVPAGSTARGPNGEYLIYSLINKAASGAPAKYYLAQWNSSNLWSGQYSGASTTPTVVPPITNGANPLMYDWNISIPSIGVGSSVVDTISGNLILGMTGIFPYATNFGFLTSGPGSWVPYTYFALNLNASKGTIGTVLWTNLVQPAPNNITVSFGGADPSANGGAGVFVERYKETMQEVGYSLATGKYLWTTPNDQVAFQYYSTLGYYSGGIAGCVLAYGRIYSAGFGGIVYCYSDTNGALLWTYGNGGPGNTTSSGEPYPGNFPTTIYAIADGVVYLVTTEHTVTTPIYKGASTIAINATNGAEIYTLSNYNSAFNTATNAIADGYAIIFNGYDNQIYCLGRGPSSTTVTAPQTAITEGNNVIIQGTVMDISVGTQQAEQTADFPHGVPVASDASMGAWMGYVYQQQAMPTNFAGITVTLIAVDPNNNTITLGTATTNINGLYSLMWKAPSVPGKYTITATFSGTNSYWPSDAQTAMAVQAPSATAAPTATPTSNTNTYVVGIGIAVIVVIIVVGAVLAILMLRKRS